MKNKKAQFYIVAAILIIAAVSGIASIKNYAISETEPRTIQEMSSELKEEGPRVIEYGIYSGDSEIEDFTQNKFSPYFLQKTQNTDIIFIYGDKDDLKAVKYNPENTGDVSSTIGGITWNFNDVEASELDITSKISNDKLIVNVLEKDYEFNIRDNKNFYFIISKKEGDEKYVETN